MPRIDSRGDCDGKDAAATSLSRADPECFGGCELALLLFDAPLEERWLSELLRQIGHIGFELVEKVDLAVPGRNRSAENQELTWSPVLALVLVDPMPQYDGTLFDGFLNFRLARALPLVGKLIAEVAKTEDRQIRYVALEGNTALNLAEQILPLETADIRRAVSDRIRDFRRSDGLRELRAGDRSKVELVERNGELAVRKTYRRCALNCMERTIEVLEHFGPSCPELARLLEKGENFIVLEYVSDGWTLREGSRRWPRPLPLPKVRALAAFIRYCLAHGFDPVDLSPGTNLIWLRDGFRVIDCEFWRRCDPATPVHLSACMAGTPADDLEGPLTSWVKDPYRRRWIAFTCLSLGSFLYDPPWLQLAKRPFIYLRLLPPALVMALANRISGLWHMIGFPSAQANPERGKSALN